MSHNIPFDIQAQIIKSLPVESLIRFRFVSKQWKSLIESSKFIAEYHTHQNHNHMHNLLVRFYGYSISDEKYVSIVDDENFPRHKYTLTAPTSLNIFRSHNLISSQGLLFVYGYDGCSLARKALIWNPTIRKSVDIDMCFAQKPDYYLTFAFGFGVCPDTCDPKIVKITYVYSPKRETIYEAFTLSPNAWRRISKNLPRECLSLTYQHVAIDRFMYWIAKEEIYMDVGNESRYKRNLIVSFDMKSEEFTEVTLPASLIVFPESILYLHKHMDSLIVVQLKYDAGKRVHSIWKMMEHGVSKSLTNSCEL